MLGIFDSLSFTEILIVVVVAVLVFGGKLPEAAGQAAAQLARLRRQLGDLRRDSGIDREIDAVRRTIEQSVPRVPRTIDVVERLAREAPQSVPVPPGPSATLPAIDTAPSSESPAVTPQPPPVPPSIPADVEPGR